ncbi:MAG: hypothetical protein FRX48_02352 [Lasallia pustulata]|uniref:Uncharacterized protein n=1 Tax=Lasallia pustulata TaxID=136370 RepID=A0A5M8PZ71_9LECA|nr:MAG: hypothetical protein FRX48_02352 [Lasallia pustulata]
MRTFHWSLLGLLFQIFTFTSAIPVNTIFISRRSRYCANAPTTAAGTLLPRSALRPLTPRTKPLSSVVSSNIWCAAGSRTYVVTTLTPAVEGSAILLLLDSAYTSVMTHLNLHGDGLIPGGVFKWAGSDGTGLKMLNANSHQLTWGVLGAAINVLGQEMLRLGTGGLRGYFTIVDGETEVGTGLVFDGWELRLRG